jgi:hypothetical protein
MDSTSPVFQYEFSSSQNKLIGDLAQKANVVGTFLAAVGILGIVVSVFNAINIFSTAGSDSILLSLFIQNLISGIFNLIFGIWIRNAAQAFRAIVKTEGHDIENLMGALGELRKVFTLIFWLLVIALVIFATLLVVALVSEIVSAVAA